MCARAARAMSGQPNLDPEQAMTMAKEEVLYRVDLFNSMVSGRKGARGWASAPRPHCSARAGVREGSSKQAARGAPRGRVGHRASLAPQGRGDGGTEVLHHTRLGHRRPPRARGGSGGRRCCDDRRPAAAHTSQLSALLTRLSPPTHPRSALLTLAWRAVQSASCFDKCMSKP